MFAVALSEGKSCQRRSEEESVCISIRVEEYNLSEIF